MKHLLASLCVWTLVLFSLARSEAETIIGVANWTASGEPAEFGDAKSPGHFANRLGDLVLTDLVTLLNDDPEFKSCKAKVVEVTRRDEVEKEIEFQQSKYVDPATAAKPGQIMDPTHVVSGHIAASGGGYEYLVEVTQFPGGSRIFQKNEKFDASATLDQSGVLAREILKKLCEKTPIHIEAAYNDLVISQDVCDYKNPFTLRGSGPAAGIVFSMQPAGEEGGIFAVGGTAAGVPWSGDGFYSLSLVDGSGTIEIIGSWKITTPAGVFGDSGTIPGTVSKASEDCAG